MPFTTCLRSVCTQIYPPFRSLRTLKPSRLSLSTGWNLRLRLFYFFLCGKLKLLFLFLFFSAMDGNSCCMLVLAGKSLAENEIAKSFKSNNTLKLPDNTQVSILLQSEIHKPITEESFNIELFMNSLSTNQLGRFLISSPRLPTTHDVIS